MATINDTQLYVTGVLYESDAYPDDPSLLFNLIDVSFREISGLAFEFLCINRAENRFSSGTTREQLLIFMKNIEYNGNKYLSDTSSASLRTAVKDKLDTLSEITYNDVEVRVTRTTT